MLSPTLSAIFKLAFCHSCFSISERCNTVLGQLRHLKVHKAILICFHKRRCESQILSTEDVFQQELMISSPFIFCKKIRPNVRISRYCACWFLFNRKVHCFSVICFRFIPLDSMFLGSFRSTLLHSLQFGTILVSSASSCFALLNFKF